MEIEKIALELTKMHIEKINLSQFDKLKPKEVSKFFVEIYIDTLNELKNKLNDKQ